MANPELLRVKRHTKDWQAASYREDQIQDPHWSLSSGGVRAPFSRESLCGYVACHEAVDGEVAHSGLHGPCPHLIKVVITKTGSSPAPYKRVRAKADEKRSKKAS
jgi:hypothetical protein